MKTIYKYHLNNVQNLVPMPRRAQLLTAQMQGEKPTLWALVDTDEPMVRRRIFIAGTGGNLNHLSAFTYIATFQDGQFVWHAFDLGEVEA